MTDQPEKPINLLWSWDEAIIALQRIRERLRRMAQQDGPPPSKPRKPRHRTFDEQRTRPVLHACCTEQMAMNGKALMLNGISLQQLATRFYRGFWPNPLFFPLTLP